MTASPVHTRRLSASVGPSVAAVLAGIGIALLSSCRGIDCEPTRPGCQAGVLAGSSPEPALVVQSNRDGPVQVYTMSSNGVDVLRLTVNPGTDIAPRWSPDGTRIAFASVRGGAGREIFVMNADGSDVRRLTSLGTTPGSPDWSPDGSRIVFHALRGVGNFALFVMNADGSNVRQLTTSDSYLVPRWSPDGSRILAVWFQTGTGGFGGRIAVLNADGSDPRMLSKQGMSDGPADWSPDGRHIVFSSVRSMGQMLVLMNADGTAEQILSTDVRGTEPSWSRSTGRIFFRDVQMFGIRSIRPDGGDFRRVSGDMFGYANPHAR